MISEHAENNKIDRTAFTVISLNLHHMKKIFN